MLRKGRGLAFGFDKMHLKEIVSFTTVGNIRARAHASGANRYDSRCQS